MWRKFRPEVVFWTLRLDDFRAGIFLNFYQRIRGYGYKNLGDSSRKGRGSGAKKWSWDGIIRVMVVALFLCCLPFAGVYAQSTPADSITITSPKEGDSVVNTAAQISGTAPPSTIVTVVITDTDTNRTGIVHQDTGKVEGTVTAGSDGNWTYVPQHQLVPGQFSVEASYTNDQNQVIDSRSVNFVVLNSKGSSVQVSNSLLRGLVIWGGLVIILIVAIVAFLINRRRRGDLKKITEDTNIIEEELARTAAELSRTNAEISALNKKIATQKGSTGPKSG